jgi:predicted RNA-binding Zn-ribbon protein involved in translation (DUF1610 family)
MALMHCPHCGAENFTMEGWEDLDHCTSCGRRLGEPDRGVVERQAAVDPAEQRREKKRPRPA